MKIFSNFALSLIFGLLLVIITPPASATENAFVPTGFQLYYGSDPTLLNQMQRQMRKGQVAVIELRGLDQKQISTLIESTHQAGTKVIAYLSIGELGQIEKANFELFLKQHKSPRALADMILSKNEMFQSWHMDVSEKAWRDFLYQRIKQIYGQNVDGLFLDTVDTSDLYINHREWPIPRRAQSVSAMIDLIREIKALSPEKFILQNRGLNLIGKSVFVGDATGIFIPGLELMKSHPHNPDGLLWETAYAHTGDWITGKEREMIQIQKNGFTTVFTLGYTDTNVDRGQFFQKSRAAGFIPAWGSSTTKLHLELTQETNAD
ncbi:MAG: endo alpha-1,4 polygalactosaminidase [Planctomycetota bacterium]